jgi:hypothetical protein
VLGPKFAAKEQRGLDAEEIVVHSRKKGKKKEKTKESGLKNYGISHLFDF